MSSKSSSEAFVNNFVKQNRHSPIEFVTGRVKSVASIEEKIALRSLSVENLAQDMQDIAGLRVMVNLSMMWMILALLRRRSDMTIVSERDYIRNRKHSGYRSYHVIVSYPVDTIDGHGVRFLRRFRLGLWP